MAEGRNSCRAIKKLCEKQNEQHEHSDADQQFGQRKAARAATLFQRESSLGAMALRAVLAELPLVNDGPQGRGYSGYSLVTSFSHLMRRFQAFA
jgi:hypothetical protein